MARSSGYLIRSDSMCSPLNTRLPGAHLVRTDGERWTPGGLCLTVREYPAAVVA